MTQKTDKHCLQQWCPASIAMGSKVLKEQLLGWAKQHTMHYDCVSVTNMSSSWKNGLAFCALIHDHYPDKIADPDTLDPKQGASSQPCHCLAFALLPRHRRHRRRRRCSAKAGAGLTERAGSQGSRT